MVEVVRSKHRPDAAHVEAVRASLAPLLRPDRAEPPATIPDPFGAGTLHVAVTRFGVGDDHGVLVAGSRNADFPTEQDRLLLGVGANQTAIVVQRRRAEEQVARAAGVAAGHARQHRRCGHRHRHRGPGHVPERRGRVADRLDARTRPRASRSTTVFRIVNEQTRQPVENPVARVLREGVVVGLANHTVLIARDGTERPIDDSAAPIRDAAGKVVGVVLVFRDVTEQQRAERQRNARLAVTQALSEAASVEDGASGVLRAVCENLGWDVGFFWTVNDEGEALVCRQAGTGPDVPVDEFETASCSRTFEQGRRASGPGVGERQTGLDTRHRTGRELPPPRLRRRVTACTAPSPVPSSSATRRSA